MERDDALIRRQLICVVEERIKILAPEMDAHWKQRHGVSMRQIADAYRFYADYEDVEPDQWKMTKEVAQALEFVLQELFSDELKGTDPKYGDFQDLASEATLARDIGFRHAHDPNITIETVEAKVAGTSFAKWSKALKITSKQFKFRSFKVFEFAEKWWITKRRDS